MIIKVPMAMLEDPSLTMAEKMLLVCLLAMDYEGPLNSQRLGHLMGAEEAVVKDALTSLSKKGYLEKESGPLREGPVVKKGAMEVKPAQFDRFDRREDQIETVRQLVEEKINYREASIILNLAGGDIERIERLYQQVKKSQFSDPLGMLINGLQKRSEKPSHHPERHQASELKKSEH